MIRALTSYRYRAVRRDGVLEIGGIEAESREHATSILSEQGLFPVEVQAAAGAANRMSHASAADLALGLRVLGTLLESGLPLSRALSVLDDLVPEKWRVALPHIRQSIREGNSLAAALGAAPLNVPPLVIGIIQAGEAGSSTVPAIRRSAEIMEASAATRAALRNALIYPTMLAAAGLASVSLLVGVVLPRFAVILSDLGQSLPPLTRYVLRGAEAAQTGALPTLAVVLGGLALWSAWTSGPEGREQWHRFLLQLPWIGSLRHSLATARAVAALAALLDNGVPVARALPHAARAAGDDAVHGRLLSAREAVAEGSSLSRALEAHRAVTATAVRLARAGEETGNLAAMIAHAARLEGTSVEDRVRRAVQMLEPTLILAFGCVVALIAAALLQAVYGVRLVP